MKRRALSLVIALALCLNLCPVWVLATGGETDMGLCPHHPSHTDACGYNPEDPDAPCAYICSICPIEELIGGLPDSVSADNSEQVQARLEEIFDLYEGLTAEEQEQVDLSSCAALLSQIEDLDAEAWSDSSGEDSSQKIFELDSDQTASSPYQITNASTFDTREFTLTSSGSYAIQIQETGKLIFRGRISSPQKSGIEVQTGGSLTITDPDTCLECGLFALTVASGTTVQLSAGKYTGRAFAIKADDLTSLLTPGCAFFDENGNQLSPAEAANAMTLIVAKGMENPTLEWASTADVSIDYDGSPVEPGDLHAVRINNTSIADELREHLQYSYQKQGDAGWTDGLPKDAGTYQVIVSLPKTDSAQAAVSDPITLIVNKIPPILVAPAAVRPVYNGSVQDLITAGRLDPVAVADGLELLFSESENGDYSTAIPTGTDAGDGYRVWYKVTGMTGNYIPPAQNPAEISDVEIRRKSITPVVTLSEDSYLYDGGYKRPAVTVRDEDHVTVLLDTEYQVEYQNNRDVGTAKVIVSDAPGGNYDLTQVETEFLITLRPQETLSITNQPSTFIYGDQFTLGTSGGSGNGDVIWEITSGQAQVGQSSGQVTITGHGNFTVKATKSGKDPATGVINYEDATASLTFTADKKPVTATVTAEDKTYDGNRIATVHATVEQGVLDGDVITITGLTGLFDDENAGVDKAVTVDTSGASIGGTNFGHYNVSYSTAPVKAAIHKATPVITTEPVLAAGLVYNGTAQSLIASGAVVDPAGVPVEYALSESGPYSAQLKLTNAGTYTIWYRIRETGNYTGLAPKYSGEAEIAKKPVTPTIKLDEDTFTYDGSAKEPAVTLYEADGTTLIPAAAYTVEYSGNIDAGTATVTVTAKDSGNYTFSQVTKNFTIAQGQARILTAPDAAGLPLTFNTYAQRLVTPGTASGGTMVYRVGNTGNFEPDLPARTDAGVYTVYYKAQGDSNHSDSAEGSVEVTIAPKRVDNPTIELQNADGTAFASCTYDGAPKTPFKVVVKDGSTAIGADEYNIVYSDNTDAGKATVNITDNLGGNYTVTGSTTFVINKADIVFAPAPAAADLTYNGSAQELLVRGTTTGGTVQYALNSETSTYTDAIPTAINAGDYTVYYKVAGDKNHNDLGPQAVPVTINPKKPATITIELAPDNFVYDGTVKLPQVTVKDEDGKTIISGDEYTWTCNVTGPKDFGTYTITIADATGGNYDLTGASPKTAAFSIGKTAQAALVIEDIPETTIYGDTFTLTTSGGSSGSAVKWSVTAGTAASVDENTGAVTVTGVGEVTITATNPGDQNYLPVSAQWTFTAAPKPVTAAVTAAGKVYDGTTAVADTAITAAVKAGDLINPSDSITISGLKGSYDSADAGRGKTVTLDNSGAAVTGADAAKYAVSYPASVMADITPKPVAVTVTLSDYDLKTDTTVTPPVYYYEYDGAVKQPTATVTDENKNVIPAGAYTLAYTDNKNVGTAAVTVTCKAEGNYTFAEETVNFEIRRAAATLTATPQAKSLTYNGAMQDLVTVGAAAGGTVVYSKTGADGSYSETIPQEKDADTYTVWYKVRGDGNHRDTLPGQVSVTIRPKEVSSPKITLAQTSYEYTGLAHEPAVTGVEDGTETIPAGEYTVTYRDNISAGRATAIIRDNNGGNYIVNGTAAFEITKKAPNFTAPTGKTGLKYNGTLQELVNAGVSGNGTVVYSLDGGNFSDIVPTASAVGTYNISWKVLGDSNHSDTDPATLTVKIDKNTVNSPTITLSSDQFKYNGSQQKPTVTVFDDDSRPIPEYEYTVAITPDNPMNSSNIVDVGTYTVTVTTADSSNYVIQTNNTRTFEIVKADQATISITGTPAQVRYGDVLQLGVTGGTGSGTISWTVTGGSSISNTGLLTVKDVGGPIKVTVTRSAGGNYNDVSAAWEFTAAKRPVTAEVTVTPKNWDGTTAVANTAITAAVKTGVMVDGDSITISGLAGVYDNSNVGTGKTVTLTGGTVGGINADKYDVTIPTTATASILAVPAMVDTDPNAVTPLTYDAGRDQTLVTPGTVTGGIPVYSLNGRDYSPTIPTAKEAGTYTVYYKVQGDQNHTDSEPKTVDVTIAKQTVTPQIELSPSGAQYDGQVKRPGVTVRDAANNVIPASEYTVVYDPSTNWKDVGPHKVTVKNIDGGNYIVTEKYETFTISTTAQNPLEIVNKPGLVYYGDTFTLSATGGSGSGAIQWSSSAEDIASVDANGLVTIKGTGPATITAKKPGGTNYGDATAAYPLNALQKPITAIVTAENREYRDGDTSATLHVTWSAGSLVGTDTIDATPLRGTFSTPDVGTNKTVTITGTLTAPNYAITVPATTTASIFKADTAAPAVTANNRDYDGTAQPLVSGGNANTRYSSTRDGVYAGTVPSGTDAGTYTVWYKQLGDANHSDSEPQSIQVTIRPKALTAGDITITLSGNDLKTDAGNYYYDYDGTEKTPAVTVEYGAAVIPAGEYAVSYRDNKNVTTNAAVTIADKEGGNYELPGVSVTFEIRRGGAQLTSSPQAKTLTYTGQAQELVNVGTAAGGHIEYAVDGGAYSEDIPKAAAAGTYTVRYKVVGDANHTDGPSGSVMVTINPKEVVSPKITVTGGPFIYTGAAQEPTVTVEDGTVTIPASEYTVTYRDNINAGRATATVTDSNGGNYTVNGTAAFEIARAPATGAAPTGNTGLKYNGAFQDLLAAAGSSSDGTMVYALSETGDYSAAIPTGKDVAGYTVWYKVLGDSNHSDSAPASVAASIVTNTVSNPTIQVTPESVTYNGKTQKPAVTVRDDNGLVIDGSEYTVTYQDAGGNPVTELTAVGSYTLAIASTGSNYSFSKTAAFQILPADQTPLTITGTRERIYYGDTIPLGTTGGNGTVTWDAGGSTIASITSGGLLTVKGVGSVTVTATSTAPGYTQQTATWTLYAEKKPVTAVVTAAAKPYDGNTTATVTAALQASDLVDTDIVTIKLSGSFEDPNAGSNKKVDVNRSSPDFTGSTGNYGNYAITYPATATASIFKADLAAADVTAPTAAENLEYTGASQPLVTAGAATGGTMEYSLDNITYSASLPTGTGAGTYTVWYRVKGDGNHNDIAPVQLSAVSIARQEVTVPTIELTPGSVSYDGNVHKPEVTVKDNNGRVIPDSEYTVTYETATDWKAVGGNHTVTVSDSGDGNYDITASTAKFEILPVGQSPLSIVDKPGRVQYGDIFTLSATGGSGIGKVVWDITSNGVASIDQNGRVTVLKAGGATVTATKQSDGNYGETTASWTFSAEKKPVTPIVTARDREYDPTDTTATLVISWRDGDLLNGDTVTLSLSGSFDNANVGTDKKVTITGAAPASDKYAITIPGFTTASITPKAATVTGVTAKANLTYTGVAQALVTEGSATGGNVAYSLNGEDYTLNVPTGTDAGSYTVWYKAQAGENYKDSAVRRETVTIAPKSVTGPVIELSPDSFEYDGTPKQPDVVVKDGSVVIPAGEYTVAYSGNTAVGSATVTITDNPGGNYAVSGSRSFTIRPGAAALTGAPQAKNLTYNKNAQELVTDGTAVNGHVVYSLTGDAADYSTVIPTGINAGTYSVYYKVKGENGAGDTAPRIVYVTIQPKPVSNPVIITNLTGDTVTYDGSAQTPTVVRVSDGGTGIPPSEYTVSYRNNTNPGTASIIVMSKSGGNYDFYAEVTFEIVKARASFATEPTAITGLTYNGTAQKLVNPGVAEGGTVFYSLDGVSYTGLIPTATDQGGYTVFAKVKGDSKHEDSEPITIGVSIGKNEVKNPTVTLSSTSFPYTGSEQKPTVTVTDDRGDVISADEYTVTYSNNIAAGTAEVSIRSKTNGNYDFTARAEFTILSADQIPLTINGKQDAVYYGDIIQLSTSGGSGTGAVTWSSSDGNIAEVGASSGTVRIKTSGSVTVTAVKAASGSYGEVRDSWTFYARPRPVTASVTAKDKVYDGGTDAELTVTVSGLLSGESVSAPSAVGVFAGGPDVGANKTVSVTLSFSEEVNAKYQISYPATTTASITPKAASASGVTARTGLIYSGSPQALVEGGAATDGALAYSLDGGSYSGNIPTAVDAGSYNVWYKAVATDVNHMDSAPVKVENVTISVNTDTPKVLCTPGTFQYDGTEKTPAVVVRDSADRIIPDSEYTVTFESPRIAVKNGYTVTVTDKPGGNYQFTAAVNGTFSIVAASQSPLSIITDIPTNVCYGDTFRLSAMGGSGSGAIQWDIEGTAATITANGVVTVTGTGGFTVTAYRKGEGGYSDSNIDRVPFEAKPKPVTPVVTASDKPYDGSTAATLTASWKSGDLVGTDSITLTVTGVFATADAGANKRVTVTGNAAGADAAKYVITWPDSTTASIYKVDSKLDTVPGDPNLTYTGAAQELVTAGSTKDNIGKVEYSMSQNGAYSEAIPTAINAGVYTVWYKVADSVNYTGVSPASIEVEIKKANPVISTNPTASGGSAGDPLNKFILGGAATGVPGTFVWENGDTQAEADKLYNVIFTPDDTANYNTVTIQIVAVSSSRTYSNAAMRTTVQNGAANTVLSAAGGNRLVNEAVANQSQNIVIQPEITSDVTKASVSIPSSTVNRISSETDAALTVSAPVANVTIPNAALDTLGSAGGTVEVVTEQVDGAVALTLNAGGETVETVPGGVTLAVPVENATPGTVAVLVNEDGTREVIRKSVVDDGMVNVPLNGSATVEIVDNSKDFEDVSSTDWSADAIDFVSSHELFNGTSETTFSPDSEMSRGMLATVLYNLEGCPDQEAAVTFSDVSSDAWYAGGVSWAAENGIVTGYGNGQYGPEDSITREQFVAMLWNYAGSPAPSGNRELAFPDADEASGYAVEALCWAVEKGILNGCPDGRLLPGGTATRAQAAQLLKNFIEKA